MLDRVNGEMNNQTIIEKTETGDNENLTVTAGSKDIINNKVENMIAEGYLVTKSEIFIYGHIRSGRTSKIKNKLIKGLREIIEKNTKLEKDNIWVYLLDLKPNQMIEYGEILPKSGGEKKWFKKLPTKLKIRLNKIDS